MIRVSIFLSFLLITSLSFGQFGGFSGRNWKRNTREFRMGFGATGFLGDLGGRDQIGTDYSPIDLDWKATSMSAMLGYRWRFAPQWALTSDLSFGMLRGSDQYTQEIIRSSRNLHFRAPVVHSSNRLEFIIYAYEKSGRRYDLSVRKGMHHYNNQIYLFAGAGVMFFVPQADLGSGWTNLRPLSTEGQGLPNGAKKYSNFTVTVPLGLGMRLATGKYWRLGIEATYNIAYSDYIDDVSTVYYDPAVLAATIGPEAALASNPAIGNQNWFAPGQQRGDPSTKDAILYVNLVFSKNITISSFRVRTERWRGKTKF